MQRSAKRIAKWLIILVPLGYFLPEVLIFYLVCGIYDVTRNKNLSFAVIQKYFLGNGVLTWVLSPINIFMDLLTLPYINKGIYKLEELPKPYQNELLRVIEASHKHDLVEQLQRKAEAQPRSMFFFKWYGANVDTSFNVPAFHESYEYIKTIGVSVFNKKESTSKHFGPIRATLRVLYNINIMDDRSAYIEVGDTINYWKDSKLFIFDDTLLHQSFNETDKSRYCLFIDITRPAAIPALLSSMVSIVRVLFSRANSIFYDKWKVIQP